MVGGLAVRFQPVPHYIPANAVEITDGGGRFTFGADCGPSEDLIAFADGTDLLMLEATLPEPEPPDDRGHLTPFEAGEHAARANAKRLVLTHFTEELDAIGSSARRRGRSPARSTPHTKVRSTT